MLTRLWVMVALLLSITMAPGTKIAMADAGCVGESWGVRCGVTAPGSGGSGGAEPLKKTQSGSGPVACVTQEVPPVRSRARTRSWARGAMREPATSRRKRRLRRLPTRSGRGIRPARSTGAQRRGFGPARVPSSSGKIPTPPSCRTPGSWPSRLSPRCAFARSRSGWRRIPRPARWASSGCRSGCGWRRRTRAPGDRTPRPRLRAATPSPRRARSPGWSGAWATAGPSRARPRAPRTPTRSGCRRRRIAAYRYTKQGTYTVTATSYWTINWSGIGESGVINQTYTSSVVVTIGELQTVVKG